MCEETETMASRPLRLPTGARAPSLSSSPFFTEGSLGVPSLGREALWECFLLHMALPPTPTQQERPWVQVAIPNPTSSPTAWWYRIAGWGGGVNRAPNVPLEP